MYLEAGQPFWCSMFWIGHLSLVGQPQIAACRGAISPFFRLFLASSISLPARLFSPRSLFSTRSPTHPLPPTCQLVDGARELPLAGSTNCAPTSATSALLSPAMALIMRHKSLAATCRAQRRGTAQRRHLGRGYPAPKGQDPSAASLG